MLRNCYFTMSVHSDKIQQNKPNKEPVAVQKSSREGAAATFTDDRPEAITQRKLKEAMNQSPAVQQLRTYQALADNYVGDKTTQRKEKATQGPPIKRPAPLQKEQNSTGLPGHLKKGIEQLSGIGMDEVKVHYNSSKPSELQALAYAKGTDIHLGPGQEKYLPHEAWHVVQQKQGRVQPTLQMKNDLINNDLHLEREADVMGERALQKMDSHRTDIPSAGWSGAYGAGGTVQLYSGKLVIQPNGFVAAVISGEETGDMSTDMLLKILRSQVRKLEWEDVIIIALKAFDYSVGKPAADGWISWAYSKLSGEFISQVMAYASPVYTGLQGLYRIFKLLPEPVQNLIVFAMGKGMRKFLAWMEPKLSPDNAEWIIDTVFVSDPMASMTLLMEWFKGLTSSPASFLFNKWRASPSSSGASSGAETVSSTGPVKEESPQPKMDTLFTMDTSILKMQLGKPKVQKGKKTKELQTASPGGLSVPFNFSIHLFDKDLQAKSGNEVILPWNGGVYLNIPLAQLTINGELANVFKIGSVVVSNLVVTDKGLQSLGIAVKDISIANGTVEIASIGGQWSKEEGVAWEANGKVNALGREFPVGMGLVMDKNGKFSKADLSIAALGQFQIIDGVFFLDNPAFSGKVAKGGALDLAFSGTPKITIADLLFQTEQLKMEYNKAAGKKGEFKISASSLSLKYGKLGLDVINPEFKSSIKQLHADEATLSYKKSNEEPTKEAGLMEKSTSAGDFTWADMLKVTPEGSFTVPELRIMGTAPFIKMGKPSVASISLSMMGVKTELDFKNKKGSLDGQFKHETKIPVLSLPIPIMPGLEAFVDIDVAASIEAILKGELSKPHKEQPPWHAKGKAGLNASVSATLSAGVQVGSQLLMAISAGLFARGKGEFKNDFSIKGGLQFINTSIKTVPGDPIKISYEIGPVITAALGIQIKAKALHVYQKVLYEREFKQWTLGKYLMKGDVTWDGEKWETPSPEGGFDENKLNDPNYKDKAITDQAELRQVLLSAKVAVVGSSEMRKALVKSVIEDYKHKDEEVYKQLDMYSRELAEMKGNRHDLKRVFLGSLRNRSDIAEIEKKITDLEKIVNALQTNYREVLLVLVDVERVLDALNEDQLNLGLADLNGQLEKLYREGPKLTQIKEGTLNVGQSLKKTE